MVENPFTALRRELDLTKIEFADVLQISTVSLHLIERGQVVRPRKALAALTRHGVDADVIQTKYSRWRQHRQKQRQKVVERLRSCNVART